MPTPRPQPPEPPVTATALLLSLPPSILCSIDLLSFTTTPQFHGIKSIPPGYHFIFTSETSSLSIRDGFWFNIPHTTSTSSNPPPLVVRKWDPSTGSLRPVDDPESYRARLAGLWERGLTPYRQSASKDAEVEEERGDWAKLTEHVTSRVLSQLTQNEEWQITSASCAVEDRDEIPGLTAAEVGEEEQELGVLGIDLKRTWRAGAVGRERTEAARDRSWALGDVAGRWREEGEEWGDVVLGQMEVCFLMVLTVANYSCLEEWKRIVGLVLTCKRAVRERAGWFATFLGLLRGQMERCEDVEGGLFDLSDEGGGLLNGLLRGFKRTLRQVFGEGEGEGEGEDIKQEMQALEVFMKREYGWDLGDDFVRRGMLELEDGERIEVEMDDMKGEDERDEYAPVVVDLDES